MIVLRKHVRYCPSLGQRSRPEMLKWLWRRRRLDEEFRNEIDAHLGLLVDRYVRSGMTRDAARAEAMRQFGNATWHREELHMMNGVQWIDGLAQDVRYAFRQVRHSVGFSAVVAATLALGIGGTTAVFSVTRAVLLAPLPYAQPGQLVRLYQEEPGKPSTRRGVSAPHFRALRDHAAALTDIGASYGREDLGLDLSRAGGGQRLRALLVTSDYFPTLRAEPFRGPGFQLDDEVGQRANDRIGARRVILSDAVWRAQFNGDPSLIGTTIQLSAEPYEVAGITPPGFEDPLVGAVDAWLPYNLARDTLTQNYSLTVVGRLRTGVSVDHGRAELAVLSQSMQQRWPEVRSSSIVAAPLQEDLVAPSRSLLQLLLSAVGLVLLVACVNVANLALVRATGRGQEFAVRAALGSSRGRLARQLIVESLVLAGWGGIAGLALAALGVSVLKTLGREALPRIDSVAFDPLVLGFAVVVTMTTALVCGVLPALHLSRSDPNRALTQQSRSATGTRRQGSLRGGLAAAQLALALALVAGAGALSVSFYRLMNVNLGFRVDGVLTFDVSLPSVRYDADRRAIFQEDLARQLAAVPGVTAAGGTSRLPVNGTFHPWPLFIDTGPLAGTKVPQPQDPEHRTVSGEFFTALAIPVLAGRTFDDRDDVSAPMRAVVSANLARIAFPGMAFESVVGQRIAVLGRKNSREIIGVVGDATIDIYGKPTSAVYSAHRQVAGNRNWALTHVVSTDGPPDRFIPAVRAVVAAMDPELVVHRAAAMTDVVGRGASRERFALVLMGTFACVSLALAAIGLYGVLAYMVRQRTPEIGIRIALGASAAQVRGLVLRQAALVVGAGIVAGIGGALVLGRSLSSLLFQTSPWDLRILLATAVMLSVTGILAAWLPARRASRMEARIAMQDS
jgi:putative ABC transport system permease protein